VRKLRTRSVRPTFPVPCFYLESESDVKSGKRFALETARRCWFCRQAQAPGTLGHHQASRCRSNRAIWPGDSCISMPHRAPGSRSRLQLRCQSRCNVYRKVEQVFERAARSAAAGGIRCKPCGGCCKPSNSPGLTSQAAKSRPGSTEFMTTVSGTFEAPFQTPLGHRLEAAVDQFTSARPPPASKR
jgi:hypothetical protein